MANKMLPLRFRGFWLVVSFVLVAAALFVCLAPSSTPVVQDLFELNDKFEHAAGYVALTLWFTGIYPRAKYIWIVIGLFAMGVAVEFIQGWMNVGRNRDPYDVIANTSGIAIGLILAMLVTGGWTQRVEALFAKREHR